MLCGSWDTLLQAAPPGKALRKGKGEEGSKHTFASCQLPLQLCPPVTPAPLSDAGSAQPLGSKLPRLTSLEHQEGKLGLENPAEEL